MFSTKLAQTLQSSSRLLRAVSLTESRALFASKAAGSPSGESGRDVRDVGTQKVNVPVGEATKKADKVGGKGAGAASQRGHEEVSGGKQQTGTNMQQKRSFTMSASTNKDKSSPNSSSMGTESGSFISQEAKKNINPGTHSENQTGGYKNLDFYPEKPGVDPFSAANRQRGGQQSSGAGGQYDTHKNPSQTGRQAEERYMDEAMTSKPGPLVDGPSDKSAQKGSSSFQSGGHQSQQSGQSSQQGGPGKGWKDTGSQSGKRSFSTSTISWTVTPAGKGTSSTGGQPAGQGTTKPTGNDTGLKGTERQRTGDDKHGKDNKKTPPSIDVGLGEINTGKSKSQTTGGKRGMATSASSSGDKTTGGKREGPGPGTKKAESIGNAEFGGEDHKGGDRRAQHAEFDSQEQRVEVDKASRKPPSIHGAIDAVKEAVTGAATAAKGAAAGAKDAMGKAQQAVGTAAPKAKNK
ncbi:hypothetical protein RvY_07570 [Ramazzottius varieornatus]|uniref:Uncharacterized protein n=1 Tax=Ramazzottius varieornatus TaxID=947166 RepID=A0A1D1V2M9_RAMVA|nr:hypothetical protein RvY_07570 [Ramazzottius varieornatus]